MTIVMPASDTATQTVKIYTDVERATPTVICPITATLTPSAAYISLSANFATISVNKSLIVLPTNIGTFTYTLTVNSLNWSGSVT